MISGGADLGTIATQRGLAAASGRTTVPNILPGLGVPGSFPTFGGTETRSSQTNRGNESSNNRTSGAVAEELAAAQGNAQVILEGELINLDSTCPSATIALGLMHLQTNNKEVAAMFKIPTTLATLAHVRPEHLLLKVAMRALVMWDSVQPTNEWVEGQLPGFLQVRTLGFVCWC